MKTVYVRLLDDYEGAEEINLTLGTNVIRGMQPDVPKAVDENIANVFVASNQIEIIPDDKAEKILADKAKAEKKAAREAEKQAAKEKAEAEKKAKDNK